MRQVQRREEVQFKEAAGVVNRGFRRPVVGSPPGIVNQSVDPPEALRRPLDEGNAVGILGEIAGDNQIVRGGVLLELRLVASREHKPRSPAAQLGRELCSDAV